MRHGMGTRRRRWLRRLGVWGVAIAALVLAGCSSGPGGAGSATTSAGSPVSIQITPATNDAVSPTTPIVVKATNGTLRTVTVTNPTKGTQVTGILSPDNTTWTSNEALGYGIAYRVSAVGADAHGQSHEQTATVNTISPKGTTYAGLIPPPEYVASGGIGVGQPLVVQFNHPVVNKSAVQQALTVTSTPSQPGAWYWISPSEVHYRAERYWKPGTTLKLTVKVYGVDFGNGFYGQEDREATYHVHDSWVAKADGATDQMQIYHNDALVMTMPISMGKGSTPTHVGPHVISAKSQKVEMNSCTYGVCSGPNAYDAIEYWDERISNDGEFVHENPETVDVQGSANVSHGCINLNTDNAIWFFNHFGPGDVVEVTNSGGPKLPIYDTYGDWEVPWVVWQAGNA